MNKDEVMKYVADCDSIANNPYYYGVLSISREDFIAYAPETWEKIKSLPEHRRRAFMNKVAECTMALLEEWHFVDCFEDAVDIVELEEEDEDEIQN